MNKMIAFFIVTISMLVLMHFKQDNLWQGKCEKMVVVSDVLYECLDENAVQSANDFFHIISGEKQKYFCDNLNEFKYKGVSLYFNTCYKLSDFEKMFSTNLTKGGDVCGYNIYYGYYVGYDDFRYVNGKKVNLQLALTETNWIVGFPLILTGF